ncbi:MAG: hypothetical protein K6C99_06405 [Lachnospiraceae bacterium]|nr:hypothetical protein [Lachnospiraceae bacterium]
MYEDNQRKRRIIILLTVLLVLLFFAYRNIPKGKQRSIAGIREPIQTEASGEEYTKVNGYDISLAYQYAYDIEGLVVCTNDYFGMSPEDKISPRDVSLAWGKVAEQNVQVGFHWKASERGLKNKVDSREKLALVGSVEDVLRQCSNNHLITLDTATTNAVKKIKVGDHIRLKGYLVYVDGHHPSKKDFFWYSSTSRDDIGSTACEIILVKSVEWLD